LLGLMPPASKACWSLISGEFESPTNRSFCPLPSALCPRSIKPFGLGKPCAMIYIVLHYYYNLFCALKSTIIESVVPELTKFCHSFLSQRVRFVMSDNNLDSPNADDDYMVSAFEFHSHEQLEKLIYEDSDAPTLLRPDVQPKEQQAKIALETAAPANPPRNHIESFSVTWEKNIDFDQLEGNAVDFTTCKKRNLLVTITTEQEERWVFEDINPDIIACQIASRIRNAQSSLVTSPLELIILGIEIGKSFTQKK
jgi:hypothetical protein